MESADDSLAAVATGHAVVTIMNPMQGRPALLLKILAGTLALTFLAGCEAPRIKSYESTEAATLTNPPRDFNAAPLDPYSWGGIAMASGGREPRTTYGAMAPGYNEGVDEVYLPSGENQKTFPRSMSTTTTYGLQDPRQENKVGQFLGSTYIDNEKPANAEEGANVIDPVGTVNPNPPRAGLPGASAQ